MKKIISYSLWGSNPKYTVGMLKNIHLAKGIYPDWIVRIYYDESVDKIPEYLQHPNVELVNMASQKAAIPPMFWRFCVNEPDVERFIVRDADSRLNERERNAVDSWIESGKKLHVMRDHPHHENLIMGGMWGLQLEGSFDIKKSITAWISENGYVTKYDWDQNYLRNILYPKYKEDLIAHDSICRKFPYSVSFPIPLDDEYRFVGEIYDENDNRYPQFKEWLIRNEIRHA
jgi:protein O-GlcNAc transferase